MKLKTVLILVCMAVVFAGLAHLTGRRQARPAPPDFGRQLLADTPLDRIAELKLESPTETVTLRRGQQHWQVVEQYQYPADAARLRRALLTLVDLKIGQRIPVDPDGMATLELTPATATRVSLSDEAGSPLATLLLGATRTAQSPEPSMPGMGGFPDGRFLSADDGQTVFLSGQTLFDLVETNPRNWIDRQILNVPARELRRIRISGPDRIPVAIQRDETDRWTLTDPADGETLDDSKVFAVEGALSHLRIAGLADPEIADAESGLDTPIVYEAVAKNGLIYAVALGGHTTSGTERYARFTVRFHPEPEAEVDDDDAEAIAAGHAKTELEAAGLHAQLQPWVFVLPAHQSDNMTRTRDSLLKAPPDGQEDDAMPFPPEANEHGDSDESDRADHDPETDD